MASNAELNLAWAYGLFEGLRAGGLREVVVSPGSRSTPLALAAFRHPKLRARVVLDERTAAFFALGMARASGRPVALVATSGTAVAEWLPAVAEADLSRVPLLLLSADRPPELRQCGANQTIDQTGLFGTRTRFTMDLPLPDEGLLPAASRFAVRAATAALWPLPGPAHLNCPFREPLVPTADGVLPSQPPPRVSRPDLLPDPDHLRHIAEGINGRPGLILCGPEQGAPLPAKEIAALAASLGVPILADPLSNLRCGPHDRGNLIALYDASLRQPAFREAARPEWVLRFGALPLSKHLEQVLAGLAGVRHILADPCGRWADPLHQADELILGDPARVAEGLGRLAQPLEGEWLSLWKRRENEVKMILNLHSPAEALIVKELGRRLPAGSLLFSGNSLPVRQLDWFLEGRDQPLRILCNRGASGIDGNVATLLGMASVAEGPVVGLVGDLTLIHDLGALTEAKGIRALILVLDNGGGAIFDHLPQAALAEREALFLTPRALDLETLAKAFGLNYRATDPDGFPEALEIMLPQPGLGLLHIRLDRELSLMQHRNLWTKLASPPGNR
ncbi:MAG: 2-succinyl-5-enolpyruvyl-6-hydroxy-3-cyclohexene-1-carboxylic-acid synthase [Gammaproteobacteria bacterium RIFOXYD12_FULL_61_37]|nr:MAG: 2-succinyl-5-enolpyruvyl-6-hydroxy-3-cyclohexene-1-carboxylic-acid synthase [Gammaproteobacteria bacterium RIFOXYD12_FULL_61_37]